MPKVALDIDAFSSGQISSKLWLCEQIENISFKHPIVIWIYGGWLGLLSFLLLSRNNLPIKHIRSFDIDPLCAASADIVNENWVWQQWRFKAFTADCNSSTIFSGEYGELPQLIINTSAEHFTSKSWYDNIQHGTHVAIQSNNLDHNDHKPGHKSLEEFSESYYMINEIFSGKLDFNYTNWSFSRYMKIGIK